MSNDYWMDVLKQNVEFGENYDAEYEKAVNDFMDRVLESE